MSKKLYFLISFVLVLSLSGLAQAGTPIVVDNNSFEYDCDGNEVTCHTGHITTPGEQCDAGIAAWRYLGSGWTGIDVNCGTEDEECDNCHDWIEYPDGTANLFFQGSASVHQILDVNLAYGVKYTMTVDLMSWDPIVLQFFALEDVCEPDVNHLLLSSTAITPDVWLNTDVDPTRWMYDRDVEAVCVITDEALVGRKLGIKIGGDYLIGGTNTDYLWADNVRLEYDWASNAYDPDPPDGAEDVNSQALTLSWLPGLWAVNDVNGHEVYFGTSWADVNSATTATTGIYRGSASAGPDVNNRYSYVIPGGDLPFALGETYFWRIDEVNEDYIGPIPQPWKGDVWSFMVEGRAKAVYPVDGAEDIPALNLILRWTAGTGAGGHDVYFGSDEAAVEDANTNTAVIYRGPTQALADVNYLVEPLEVGKEYFWRIDEVNTAAGTLVTGDVWSFTTGVFLIVDSFDSYVDKDALRAVWKDASTGTLPKNGAELSLETSDANMILGGEQSMLFAYRNFAYNLIKGVKYYVGSEAEAALPLEIGTDWTAGGVKALVLYFYGDADNGQTGEYYAEYHITNDQMYVAVEDGSSNVGVVKYDTEHDYDMNAIKEASWHEWNIELADPCLVAVDMNNVAKVYIGFGGQKTGQMVSGAGENSGNFDTVWFDDIRLYPPRCIPAETSITDFTGDCVTDYSDFDIMAEDWLMTDGNVVTENRPAVLTDFPDATSHWTTDCAVGTGAIEANEGWNIDVTDPRLVGLESMSITAWVKQTIDNSWVGIVSSRESVGCGDDATELGIYGGEFGGPDGLGYDWSCGTEEWQFDAGLDVPEDGTWTFIAMSVDPTGCTLYMRPIGSALQTGVRNVEVHPAQQNFSEGFTIGNDDKSERAYFVGKIDDVRIYNYHLSFSDINDLAYQAGEPTPGPVYRYELDETEGLVAADSGFGMDRYAPVQSKANITDPEAQYQRSVNFRDYRILADNWLEQHPWP